MIDKPFDMADSLLLPFAKLLLGMALAGAALFLVVTSAPVGLAFILMVFSIARWMSR